MGILDSYYHVCPMNAYVSLMGLVLPKSDSRDFLHFYLFLDRVNPCVCMLFARAHDWSCVSKGRQQHKSKLQNLMQTQGVQGMCSVEVLVYIQWSSGHFLSFFNFLAPDQSVGMALILGVNWTQNATEVVSVMTLYRIYQLLPH